MRRERGIGRSLTLLALLAAVGCGPEPDVEGQGAEATDRVGFAVYTVSYPLRYYAGRIGGEGVQVRFPAPPGVDPALWSPDAETIALYQGADRILLNGARYARWVTRATLPPSRLVDTSGGFQDRYVPMEAAMVHTHGPTGEHSHGEVATTTWLDPQLAAEQARAILEAFTAARPAWGDVFGENFAALERDLGVLDDGLREAFAGLAGRPLLTSHPVYQYLARRYDLNLRSVHFEPDEVPGEGQWRDLETLLRSHPARWMLWEAEPLPETAERLRGYGVEAVVFDPCGNAPPDGDFLTVMRENIAAIVGIP